MHDDSLKSLLERYGKVENISTPLKKFGYYDSMTSDERVVWMVVEFPIPSSLFIRDSETYIYFSYLEQPKTCHKCGSEFHMVEDCNIYRTTKPKDRQNAVALDQVPTPNTDPLDNDTDSDSNFGDSRSVLSTDSDTNNIILMPDPSQSAQVNVNNNLAASHVPNSIANTDSSEESHASNQNIETGEIEGSNQNIQAPIPQARSSSSISSSQPPPASYSIYNQIKRALSLSPESTSEHHSTPKSARLTGNVQFV